MCWLTVDRGQGRDISHHGSELSLEIILENLGSFHSLVHRDTRDIPSANDKVIRVHHGQHVGNRHKDIFTRLGVGTESDSRSSDERTDIVGLLKTILGVPGDSVLVGKMSREDRGSVISAQTDQEKTKR